MKTGIHNEAPELEESSMTEPERAESSRAVSDEAEQEYYESLGDAYEAGETGKKWDLWWEAYTHPFMARYRRLVAGEPATEAADERIKHREELDGTWYPNAIPLGEIVLYRTVGELYGEPCYKIVTNIGAVCISGEYISLIEARRAACRGAEFLDAPSRRTP